MSRPVAHPADRSTRLMRGVVPFLMRATGRLRGHAKGPHGLFEARYGDDPDERIERLAPAPNAPERLPVVYLHGGGWILGTKESYTRHLAFLADAGYPVYNVEYPLAPEHPHPSLLRSLLAALDWIRLQEPDLPGIHLMGDSAGGNLAMMLALLLENPRLLADVDPDRTEAPLACRSVVSIYGVLDRLTWIEDGFPGAENMLESYAGSKAFAPEVDARLAITPLDLEFAHAPPSLLTCGTKDPLRRSSTLFAERLRKTTDAVEHREYPDEGHGFFSLGRSKHAPAMNADILAFLERQAARRA